MSDNLARTPVDILLVEDDPNDAELTLRALSRHHLADKVQHVKDGVEALDFLFARGAYAPRAGCTRPKVILLDLKLPKVDGLEVLRAIRADKDKGLIPVVILTSSKEEAGRVESYRIGANSYVVKPVEFAKFVEVVSELALYWLLLNQPPCDHP